MDSPNASKSATLRNRLISLLYLCFISMIAISVSKEVLSGFGQIWSKTEQSNLKIANANDYFYAKLKQNIEERPEFWKAKEESIKSLKQHSKQLNDYIATLKIKATEDIVEEDPDLSNYEVMDKGDDLDNILFVQGEGEILVDKIKNYVNVVSKISPEVKDDVVSRFSTDPVINDEGTKIDWVNYNYEGFPLVSSLAKLTQIQNDVRVTENDVLARITESELEAEAETQTTNFNNELNVSKLLNATVTADKMNVVYRSVDNPLTIVIPGVAPNRIRASAPGLTRVKGTSYILKPRKGRVVNVKASGTLADGTVITGEFPFRIKEIPAPVGAIRGSTGSFTRPRSSLDGAVVKVLFPGFDFETDAVVTSFRVQVPGSASVLIEGDKMTDKAYKLIKRARAGTKVFISDIRAKSPTSKYLYKNASPIVVTLS